MAVENQDPRIQYIADGTHNIYTYPFRIFQDADLQVYKTPPNQTPDPATDLLPPSDYTVSGAGDEDGGTVTITSIPVVDSIITIVRDIAIERTSDYSTGGEFTGESINNALDLLTLICQQLESLTLDRSLTYEVTEQLTSGDTTLPKLPAQANDSVIPIWTKNQAGNLVAAELDENTDASTLRSELANETLLGQGALIVGYNNASMGGPQTVRAALDTLKSDIDTANTNISNNTTNITTNTNHIAILDTSFFRGLNIQNNISDANNDIDFLAGACRSSDDTQFLVLASTLTKKLDVAWAAGTNQGGLFSGSKAINTTYHCFLIRKDSDGSIDSGFDTSINAANKPVGYSTFRRVASFYTDGSGNIIAFTQKSDEFLLMTPVTSVTVGNPGTAAVLSTLNIPIGIKVGALISVTLNSESATDRHLLITSPDQNDTVPTLLLFTIANVGQTITAPVARRNTIYGSFRTNTSAQIRWRLSASAADVGVWINTYGWIDDRGRFD